MSVFHYNSQTELSCLVLLTVSSMASALPSQLVAVCGCRVMWCWLKTSDVPFVSF